MSHKGTFSPVNPSKYVGNAKNIIFRSAWERTFMEWCDRRNEVLQWASEELHIPYFFPPDGKWHRYYPDFLLKVQTGDDKREVWVVEIKPAKQVAPPPQRKSAPRGRQLKEAIEYAKNQSKWKAAKAYCDAKGWKFVVLTERDLYPKT